MSKYSITTIDDISLAIYQTDKNISLTKFQDFEYVFFLDSISEKTMINILAFLYKYKSDYQEYLSNIRLKNKNKKRPNLVLYEYLLIFTIVKINKNHYWYRQSYELFKHLQIILSFKSVYLVYLFRYLSYNLIQQQLIYLTVNHSFLCLKNGLKTLKISQKFQFNECHCKQRKKQIIQTLDFKQKLIIMQRWQKVKARIELQNKQIQKNYCIQLRKKKHLHFISLIQIQLNKLTIQNLDDITCININIKGLGKVKQQIFKYSYAALINMFAFLLKNKQRYLAQVQNPKSYLINLYEFIWGNIFYFYLHRLCRTRLLILKAKNILRCSTMKLIKLFCRKYNHKQKQTTINQLIIKTICLEKCKYFKKNKNNTVRILNDNIFFKCQECSKLYQSYNHSIDYIIDQGLTESQMLKVTERVQKIMQYKQTNVIKNIQKVRNGQANLKVKNKSFDSSQKLKIIEQIKLGQSKLNKIINIQTKCKHKQSQQLPILLKELGQILNKLEKHTQINEEKQLNQEKQQNMDYSFGLKQESQQESYHSLIQQLYE